MVKSIFYNQFEKKLEITYYSSLFTKSKATFDVDELLLEHVTHDNSKFSYFILKNNTFKFILPEEESKSTLDSRLLAEIFNHKSKDHLLESLLIKGKGLIDFSCPVFSNPNNALDHLLRKNYLAENENISSLSAENYKEKLISIADNKIAAYKEQQTNIAKSSDNNSELNVVEDLLRRAGIEKAQEGTKYLSENFAVSKVDHVKNLGDYELKQLVLHLQLTADQIVKFHENFRRI